MLSRFFRNANSAESKDAAPARILFDHIPKTGGMSLHAVLQAVVGADQCSNIIVGSIDEVSAGFARYRCVSGHLYFHPGADLSDSWSFTVLRKPIDRVLSHLAYIRYDVPSSGDALIQQARAIDLESAEMWDSPQAMRLLSNTMVAHFAPLAWNGRDVLDDDRSLALAKEALRRFDLVGITERMDETVDLLCHGLGTNPPPAAPRLNTSSRSITLDSLPASSRDRLRQLNALDLELYALACELLGRARRRALFPALAGKETAAFSAFVDPLGAESRWKTRAFGTRQAEVVAVDVAGEGEIGPTLLAGENAVVRVAFKAREALDDLTVGMFIHDDDGRLVFATNTRHYGHALSIDAGGEGAVSFSFRADLGTGHYWVGASLHPSISHLPICYHWAEGRTFFDVVGSLGWNFAGATKLYPQLAFEGVDARTALQGPAAPNVQLLSRLAPALTNFRARIAVPQPLLSIPPSQRIALRMDIANIGTEMWPSLGERSVRVSYHWLDNDGTIIVLDGERTYLPRDVAPGEEVSIWATVNAPPVPGDYRLQLSLVQENVAWLENVGGDLVDMRVSVRDGAAHG